MGSGWEKGWEGRFIVLVALNIKNQTLIDCLASVG